MTRSVKTTPIEVVCPVCDKRWMKPIMNYGELDDAGLYFVSEPTCCSKECREKRWKQFVRFVELEE